MADIPLLRFQAATAHSFHLPEDLALQSVTSVPARSLEIDHRVGFVRPGYDADIVVWDSFPLQVGATPLQVYIDGKATLDPAKVKESLSKVHLEKDQPPRKPNMRATLAPKVKESVCNQLEQPGAKIVITGITMSYLDNASTSSSVGDNLTMVINEGEVVCFKPHEQCISASSGGTIISLENGYVLPGLTAVSVNLGLTEISGESSTGDGSVSNKINVEDPKNVVYAKYGVHLEGKAFQRARIGGVTRAISAPLTGDGFLTGVSVGIKTSGKKTILNGGIFQSDVALHLVVGQASKRRRTSLLSSRGSHN